MKEKTLRYPGHAQLIQKMKDQGLFNMEIIEKTAKSLKKAWFLEEGEEEFTVMRIIIKNTNQKIQLDLYDEYHQKTQITSMARTTGYTCSAGVNLITNNLFTKKGVFPPEIVGKQEIAYKFIIDYLSARDINLKTTVE